MYAIAFDLEIAVLKTEYGDPYNNAYFEIRKELANLDFDWTQGSVYLHTGKGGLAAVYRAINKLEHSLVQEIGSRHSRLQGGRLVGLYDHRERGVICEKL